MLKIWSMVWNLSIIPRNGLLHKRIHLQEEVGSEDFCLTNNGLNRSSSSKKKRVKMRRLDLGRKKWQLLSCVYRKVSLLNTPSFLPTYKQSSPDKLTISNGPDLSELSLPSNMFTEFPDPDDTLNFKLTIKPDEGIYKGGCFHFTFAISQNFPHEAPKVKCIEKIYHPNIDLEGNVCLNILREDWKPVLNIQSVVVGLQVRNWNPFLYFSPKFIMYFSLRKSTTILQVLNDPFYNVLSFFLVPLFRTKPLGSVE